eukprot:967493-Rhodomonas_salina.1
MEIEQRQYKAKCTRVRCVVPLPRVPQDTLYRYVPPHTSWCRFSGSILPAQSLLLRRQRLAGEGASGLQLHNLAPVVLLSARRGHLA